MALSTSNYFNLVKDYGKYLAAGLFYVLLFKILLMTDRWFIDFIWYWIFLTFFFCLDFLFIQIIKNNLARRIAIYFLSGLVGVFFVSWLTDNQARTATINFFNFVYSAGLIAFPWSVFHRNKSKDYELDVYVWLLVLGSMFVSVNGLFYFILHNQDFWKLVIILLLISWHFIYWREFYVVRREQLDEILAAELAKKKMEDDMVIEIKGDELNEEDYEDDDIEDK